ncbi:MarR family winged helix-turn-helix transcriptional regulator [Breznakiella homolactica]|uniref:MarR family transcriptional regulator n=1 Tax=Breznakiella homolactica TaxID=2798577 RepID=A0A7T7XK87_9SPIR|nr:MarR family transcriptional regulator [Breznakiella homolactica]QQO07782.1 MarR family transcriptional regulator [Breznakiella homolactica]
MMIQEQPLVFRIKSLSNQIKRLLDKSAIAGNDANLTGMQYAILGYLAERDDGRDVFQRDIEAEFNIRRSTATGMLQLLEKNGYIKRGNVSGDARLKKITMTGSAKELNKVARANIKHIQGRLLKGISKEEMEQFYRVLEKITANARD